MIRHFLQIPHRRFNPLTEEWILVSPQRLQRPWLGKTADIPARELPAYDPECYLCPGNKRAGGHKNPGYKNTFVFDNDYPALLPQINKEFYQNQELLIAISELGICRVICFSPQHNLTLAEMSEASIRQVVEVWVDQYCELGSREYINYVQIFENKGELMGCSNPHPHGQIWATQSLPVEVEKEHQAQKKFYTKRGNECLLCNYLQIECLQLERIVCENKHWVALVPFWAKWPYETLLLPRRHLGSLAEINKTERSELANILKRITIRYDNLFQVPFPYTMGIHQSPTDGLSHPYWHLHVHFYPPLLRSATVQKFMVGFEMLGTPQRDFSPEEAAERLRNLSETHYKSQSRSNDS